MQLKTKDWLSFQTDVYRNVNAPLGEHSRLTRPGTASELLLEMLGKLRSFTPGDHEGVAAPLKHDYVAHEHTKAPLIGAANISIDLVTSMLIGPAESR